MRRVLAISLLALALSAQLSAQKLSIGSRAPRVDGVEWISDNPNLDGRAMVVEFFHSSNPTCIARIDNCNALAATYSDRLNYLMIAREPEEQIAPLLFKEYQHYYIAVDESGRLFDAFGARYVPYAVVVDRRGIVRWIGNPAKLTSQIIESITK